MIRHTVRIFLSAFFLALFFSSCIVPLGMAAQEEILIGIVEKRGKGFVIEADEGDFIAKGKNLSKFVGKLVEVTGTISSSDKGDTIEIKSVQIVEDTLPD